MSKPRNPETIKRERAKREGIARRAQEREHERLNGEYNDPWTGERIVRVNGIDTQAEEQ